MSAHHDHAHARPTIFSQRPVLTGVVIGVATLAPHAFLTPQVSLAFAALLIALIAGVYFGFAVVSGSFLDQFVEFGVATLFAVAGLLGLLHWPVVVPLAYFGHAAWDFAHHNRARLSLVAIPQWYVPWCAIIDVIVGSGLLLIWRAKGLV